MCSATKLRLSERKTKQKTSFFDYLLFAPVGAGFHACPKKTRGSTPKCFLRDTQGNDGRPTGRPYKWLLNMRPVGTTRGASRLFVFHVHDDIGFSLRRVSENPSGRHGNLPLLHTRILTKKRQKTHRSRNKFALRCGYRRTVDEKNFDCGAFFDEFQPVVKRLKMRILSFCFSFFIY